MVEQTARFFVNADGITADSAIARELLSEPGAQHRTARLLGAVHDAFDPRFAPDEFIVSLPVDDRHLAAELIARAVAAGRQPAEALRLERLAAAEAALPTAPGRPWADTMGLGVIMWPSTSKPLIGYLTGRPYGGGGRSLGDAVHALVHERGHTLNQGSGGADQVIEGYVETLTQWPGRIARVVHAGGLPDEAAVGTLGYPEGVVHVRNALDRLGLSPSNPTGRVGAEALFSRTDPAALDAVLGLRPSLRSTASTI